MLARPWLHSVRSPSFLRLHLAYKHGISTETVQLFRSVLASLFFTAYITSTGSVIESYDVSYHQFAVDTQPYVVRNLSSVTDY